MKVKQRKSRAELAGERQATALLKTVGLYMRRNQFHSFFRGLFQVLLKECRKRHVATPEALGNLLLDMENLEHPGTDKATTHKRGQCYASTED